MSRRRKTTLPAEPVTVEVERLSHDGRGVAHVEGKTVFVGDALPGEKVVMRYVRRHRDFDESRVEQVLQPSPLRVTPRCGHFGVCGGCSLQHMAPGAQIETKQRTLCDHLEGIGGVEPESLLPPLRGPHWGYRRRARLGVKFVNRKNRLLVGFRERHARYVTDMQRCDVLLPAAGMRLQALALLIDSLTIRSQVPQVELAAGDAAAALVFRHLAPLSPTDRDRLVTFGRTYGLHIYLQPGGPETVAPLWPGSDTLSYRLDEFDLDLCFAPTEFTQVNAAINRQMVVQAVDLLDPQPGDHVLDLFCGVGNFTLPLARHAGAVLGVEGESVLVERARHNAVANGIDNAVFFASDLFGDSSQEPWARGRFDKVLLDPPRTGAGEVIEALPGLGPARVVYVSCNSATLARDAGVLVKEQGYRLRSAGVMDMFPHTAHFESMALFERN